MINRLKDDHKNAKKLAHGISNLNGIELNMDLVPTNIIYFNFNHLDMSSADLVSHMASNNIIFSDYNGKHCRLVLHPDVTSDDVEKVVDVFNKLLS